MEESPKKGTIAQRFDGYSTALSVLQGRDLSGKYAIVTGANSGVGKLTNVGHQDLKESIWYPIANTYIQN